MRLVVCQWQLLATINPKPSGAAYKIKLRTTGYRLIYIVDDGQIVAVVLAVVKRERKMVCRAAQKSAVILLVDVRLCPTTHQGDNRPGPVVFGGTN